MYVVLIMNRSGSVVRAFQCANEEQVLTTTGWLAKYNRLCKPYDVIKKAVLGGAIVPFDNGRAMQTLSLSEVKHIDQEADGSGAVEELKRSIRTAQLACKLRSMSREEGIKFLNETDEGIILSNDADFSDLCGEEIFQLFHDCNKVMNDEVSEWDNVDEEEFAKSLEFIEQNESEEPACS